MTDWLLKVWNDRTIEIRIKWLNPIYNTIKN